MRSKMLRRSISATNNSSSDDNTTTSNTMKPSGSRSPKHLAIDDSNYNSPSKKTRGDSWKNMDVRTSIKDYNTSTMRNYLMRNKRYVALGVFIFFVLVKINSSTNGRSDESLTVNNSVNNNDELVAPIHGEAYLTPDEFLNIRTARDHESVLVTGGLGFIGSHVVDLLLHRGFKVTILDNESNGHNHNKYTNELVPNDITMISDFPPIPTVNVADFRHPNLTVHHEGYYTHVIHLAASISVAESMTHPQKYEEVNYEGSQKVLDWIYKYNSRWKGRTNRNYYIKKVVAASSAAIYGDRPELLPLQESAGYGGKSPYADTKFRMEGLLNDFVTKQNDENDNILEGFTSSAVALRFFNVYGPRQDPKSEYSGVISLFLDKAMKGNDITVLGDGLMTRDFIYVKDVARAIVLACLQEEGKNYAVKEEGGDSKASFAVYNVCTGKSITINTLANQIKTSMDSTSEITHLDPRDGDIRESSCNPNAAKSGIGFVSAVSQEGGLEKTAGWFRENEEG